MRIPVLTAIALAAVAVTACEAPDGSAIGGAEAAAAAAPAAVGEVVRVGDIEYTITGVEAVNRVGSNPYLRQQASDGATFVVVNWTMKNAGTKPMEFFEKATMHLVDGTGTEYSSDDEATMAYGMEADLTEKTFGDLNPGITSRGADVYEIASASYDPTTWTLKLDGADRPIRLQ